MKLIWTVDAVQSKHFSENYLPGCDMIFIHINWQNGGEFCFILKEVQINVLNKIGREQYIKLPKAGTNPRGVEMTAEGLNNLTVH